MYIVGSGHYLPGEDPVTNEMLASVFGDPVRLLGDYFGVKSRYFTVNYRTGVTADGYNSDFCFRAVQNAQSRSGFDLQKIGLIVCASNTPDYLLPQLSTMLQDRLGIPHAIPFDIRGGCAAPIQAMQLVDMYFQHGMVDHALVVGSECFSTIYYSYLLANKSEFLARDLMNCLIFGDGAAALILSRHKGDTSCFAVSHISVTSSFSNLSPGFVVSLGGSRAPHFGDSQLSLGTLMSHYPKTIQAVFPQVLRAFYQDVSLVFNDRPEFRYIVGPQANKRLMTTLQSLFSHNQTRYFYYGDVTGNVPGGALLLALDRLIALEKLAVLESVLMMGVESPKWIYGYAMITKES